VAEDPLTPSSQANFTQKNRLSGVAYDGNGNQTQVNPYTLSYDGENQVSDVFSAMNGSARYDYSGDGRRVQKVVGNAVTQYVYDAMGELAAEYTYGAAPPNSPQGMCTTCFLFADQLGSTRAVWDGSGVKGTYDYLPGGELVPGERNNRGVMRAGYGFYGTVRQEFTGKERDAETGLDYFGRGTTVEHKGA
jgi:hypothetical protein